MKLKKIASIAVLFSVLFSLFTGCGGMPDDGPWNMHTADSAEKSEPTEFIKKIKKKYNVSPDTEIAPFYNVDQKSGFLFHFNSKVQPIDAVTVHTDPECGIDSMVYCSSEGYWENGKTEVYISPKSPVLNSGDREKLEDGNWGHAPIYYLCVHYDMDSSSTRRLESPTVIPFTVDFGMSTPDAMAAIGEEGEFCIKWDAIEEAKGYRIYQISPSKEDSPAAGMKRIQCAYIGDEPALIAEVDEPGFDDFSLDQTGNTIQKDGFIIKQNASPLNTYYVTAIGKDGTESGYSRPVAGWMYEKKLPVQVSGNPFENAIKTLPETVSVEMGDGSISEFPAYYDLKEQEGDTAKYLCRIGNTKLECMATVKNKDFEFQEHISPSGNISPAMVDIENHIPAIPPSGYGRCKGNQKYVEEAKDFKIPEGKGITYNVELYEKREKMEEDRKQRDGVYAESANPIGVFLGSDKRVKWKGISLGAKNTKLKDFKFAAFADSAEEEYLAVSMIDVQNVISVEHFPKLKNIEYLQDVIFKIIYQNPYIMGVKNFSYDMEDMEIHIEYYRKREDIKRQQEEIKETSDRIIESQIQDGMTDEEKVKSLWDYLEANAKYDSDAYEKAAVNGFSDISGMEDSFSVYGVICNGRGVCQSYMHATKLLFSKAGLECMSLTGYIQNSVPHGWNIVKLDGKWYWMDCTNSMANSGIPYFIYQTSEEFASASWNYVLDTLYALDSNLEFAYTKDMSKDYYASKGLYAEDEQKLLEIIKKNAKKKSSFSIKCKFVPDVSSEEFSKKVGNILLDLGWKKDEVEHAKISRMGQVFTFSP